MNRFAQPLYGKIIDIFETNLKMEELSTVFDPSTYWIDVTGVECEVGYLVEYKAGVGLVFAPPPKPAEPTVDDYRALKLEQIKQWTEEAITGGFKMELNGLTVKFDSDTDTQNTMALMYNASRSADFATTPPYNGLIPCRGKIAGEGAKVILDLNQEDMQRFVDNLARHIGACKQYGWQLQTELNEAITKEDIEAIVWAKDDEL